MKGKEKKKTLVLYMLASVHHFQTILEELFVPQTNKQTPWP
jgi:hypothetical protein